MSADSVADSIWSSVVALGEDAIHGAMEGFEKKGAEEAALKALSWLSVSLKETILNSASLSTALTQITAYNWYASIGQEALRQASLHPEMAAYHNFQAQKYLGQATAIATDFIRASGVAGNIEDAIAGVFKVSKEIAKKAVGPIVGAVVTYRYINHELEKSKAAGEPPEKAAEIVGKNITLLALTTIGEFVPAAATFINTGTPPYGLNWAAEAIPALAKARAPWLIARAGYIGAAISLSFEGGWQLGAALYRQPAFANFVASGIDSAIDFIHSFTQTTSADRYPSEMSTIALLVSRVDPKFTMDGLNGLLQASAPTCENLTELTALHNSLRKIFLPDLPPDTSTTNDTFLSAVVQTLVALKKNYPNQTFSIVSLVGKSADQIVAAAQNPDGLATRYALSELNPFAVLGVDYSRFNQKGELDLVDPATGKGNLSNKWLTDRTAMLAWANHAGTDDTEFGPGQLYADAGSHNVLQSFPQAAGASNDPFWRQTA